MSNNTEPNFIDGKGSDFIAFEEYVKNSPIKLSSPRKKRKKLILLAFIAFSALVSYKIITAQTLITNNIIDIEKSKKLYTEQRNETQKILETISTLYLRDDVRADTFDRIKELNFNEQVFLANNYSKFILNMIFFGVKDVEISNEEIKRIFLIYSDLVSCVRVSAPKVEAFENLLNFEFITFKSDGTQKEVIYEESKFNNNLNKNKSLQLLFTDKYIELQNQKNLGYIRIDNEANIVSLFKQSDMILDFNLYHKYIDITRSDLISLNKKIFEKNISNEKSNKIYEQFWKASDYQKKFLWDNYYKKDYQDYFNKKMQYKNIQSSWFINSNLQEMIKNEGINISKRSQYGSGYFGIYNFILIEDLINTRDFNDFYLRYAPELPPELPPKPPLNFPLISPPTN